MPRKTAALSAQVLGTPFNHAPVYSVTSFKAVIKLYIHCMPPGQVRHRLHACCTGIMCPHKTRILSLSGVALRLSKYCKVYDKGSEFLKLAPGQKLPLLFSGCYTKMKPPTTADKDGGVIELFESYFWIVPVATICAGG